MHWMDARALRRNDAFKGERPWGDTVCDPWIEKPYPSSVASLRYTTINTCNNTMIVISYASKEPQRVMQMIVTSSNRISTIEYGLQE
ncbi:hypothetical protein Tco_0718306 [Tanacetum coccineum]